MRPQVSYIHSDVVTQAIFCLFLSGAQWYPSKKDASFSAGQASSSITLGVLRYTLHTPALLSACPHATLKQTFYSGNSLRCDGYSRSKVLQDDDPYTMRINFIICRRINTDIWSSARDSCSPPAFLRFFQVTSLALAGCSGQSTATVILWRRCPGPLLQGKEASFKPTNLSQIRARRIPRFLPLFWGMLRRRRNH